MVEQNRRLAVRAASATCKKEIGALTNKLGIDEGGSIHIPTVPLRWNKDSPETQHTLVYTWGQEYIAFTQLSNPGFIAPAELYCLDDPPFVMLDEDDGTPEECSEPAEVTDPSQLDPLLFKLTQLDEFLEANPEWLAAYRERAKGGDPESPQSHQSGFPFEDDQD